MAHKEKFYNDLVIINLYKLQKGETDWLISKDGRQYKKVHHNWNVLLNNLFRYNFPLNQVLTVKKNSEKWFATNYYKPTYGQLKTFRSPMPNIGSEIFSMQSRVLQKKHAKECQYQLNL